MNHINDAVEKAHKAFLEYRLFPASKKISFLNLIADTIETRRNDLSKIAGRETSLPDNRLQTEITRTVNQLRLFSALLKEGTWRRAIIEHAAPDRKPLPKPDLRQL